MGRPSQQSRSAALDVTAVNWAVALGLGAVGLIRPLGSILGLREVLGGTVTAVGLTVVVSLVWILTVGLSRVPQPFLTLVFAGVAYGVYAIVLSAVLSPLVEGELQGPLTNPFAVVAVLVTNAFWGAVCGLLALLVRRLRR